MLFLKFICPTLQRKHSYGQFFNKCCSGSRLRYLLDFLAFVWSYMARQPNTMSICFRFSFRLGRLTRNLHFYDLHTSSYKMIYFLSNIYKWTLTLISVESSSAVFAITFHPVSRFVYALIQDGSKSHESAYSQEVLGYQL